MCIVFKAFSIVNWCRLWNWDTVKKLSHLSMKIFIYIYLYILYMLETEILKCCSYHDNKQFLIIMKWFTLLSFSHFVTQRSHRHHRHHILTQIWQLFSMSLKPVFIKFLLYCFKLQWNTILYLFQLFSYVSATTSLQ